MRHLFLASAVAIFMGSSATAQTDSEIAAEYYGDLMIRATIVNRNPCEIAGLEAARVMHDRYAGTSMSTMMNAATMAFERDMIHDAYAQRRMASESMRREQTFAFREKYERACYIILGESG